MKHISLMLIGFLIISCSIKHNKENDKVTTDLQQEVKKQTDAVNPNGTSELALLMRQMTDELENAKRQITKGDKFILDVNHNSLLTAKPTAPFMKKESYNGFAQTLIYQFNELQIKQDVTTFNNVVNSCIACHQQSCPGPIVRINKLYMYE